MSVKAYTKTILLAGLIVLALGGFLLHSRIHPLPVKTENMVSGRSANIVPAVCGILSIIVVPILFLFRRTIAYGYVLNGFTVIVGTITMAHYSIVFPPDKITVGLLMTNTLLADILILWGKFFVGKAIFDLEFFGYDAAKEKKGVTYRYPNLGWWLIHLAGVSIVYYLGNLLWRQI